MTNRDRRECFCLSATIFVASGAIVFLGALIGALAPADGEPESLLQSLVRFDAGHYCHLIDEGYAYAPQKRSEVAFFPAFPLTGRFLKSLTGSSSVVALLIVAHACLVGAFVAFMRYLEVRRLPYPRAPRKWSLPEGEGAKYALWAFVLLPTTFFFRMPYSESMFLLVTLLALLGMERRWAVGWFAAIVGLATAVRPVGVGLIVPLAWYAWKQTRAADREVRHPHPGPLPEGEGIHALVPLPSPLASRPSSLKPQASRLLRLALVMPLGCWGLLTYMAFQQIEFGDALAFAKTQTHWRLRPDLGLGDKLLGLASWEPIWAPFIPGDRVYFGGFGDSGWLEGMRLFNPVFFVGTAVLIGVGAWKRWLTSYEILLSITLLAIPYVTKAYENSMESQGRFAAVVVPAYIVMGQLLARLPWWLAWLVLAASGAGLAFFTSRYAAGYLFF